MPALTNFLVGAEVNTIRQTNVGMDVNTPRQTNLSVEVNTLHHIKQM
jgi:hypothetical protein